MTPAGGIPTAVFARIDSTEHRLRDEMTEHREEQARRNDHTSERLSDIEQQLAGINTGIKIGVWLAGGFGALLLAVGVGVLHLVLR